MRRGASKAHERVGRRSSMHPSGPDAGGGTGWCVDPQRSYNLHVDLFLAKRESDADATRVERAGTPIPCWNGIFQGGHQWGIWERQAWASVSLAGSEPANSCADGLRGDGVNDFRSGIVDLFSRRR